MFTGEYRYSIDDKGRLFIPAEFRKIFGEKVVINRGIEKCLCLYTVEDWEKIVEKLTKLSFTKKNYREFNRMFLSGAFYKDIDTKGRVNIDDMQLQFAGLAKECVILGVGETVEVWDKATWEQYYLEKQDVLSDISEGIDFDE